MMTSSVFLSIIDNIYDNNLEQEATSRNILIQFADHLAQFLSIKKKIIWAKHIPVYRRNFSDYNEQLYIDVSIQTWNPNKLQDTNNGIYDFVWRLVGCDRHAPDSL